MTSGHCGHQRAQAPVYIQTLQLLNRQINGPFWETVLFEPWPLTSKTKEKDKAQLSTELSAAGPAALGVHFHQIPCRCLPWQQAQLQPVRTEASATGVLRSQACFNGTN